MASHVSALLSKLDEARASAEQEADGLVGVISLEHTDENGRCVTTSIDFQKSLTWSQLKAVLRRPEYKSAESLSAVVKLIGAFAANNNYLA